MKNKDDGVVRATPVFVLSNRLTFPDTPEFNCRLHKYEWRSAPLLKHYKKKPDPRAINMLLMYSGECEHLLPHDVSLIVDCKKLVVDIVHRFGELYYEDTDYIKYLKEYNKHTII